MDTLYWFQNIKINWLQSILSSFKWIIQSKTQLLREECKGFVGSRSAQLWSRFDQRTWMFVLQYNQDMATLLGKRGKVAVKLKDLFMSWFRKLVFHIANTLYFSQVTLRWPFLQSLDKLDYYGQTEKVSNSHYPIIILSKLNPVLDCKFSS